MLGLVEQERFAGAVIHAGVVRAAHKFDGTVFTAVVLLAATVIVGSFVDTNSVYAWVVFVAFVYVNVTSIAFESVVTGARVGVYKVHAFAV